MPIATLLCDDDVRPACLGECAKCDAYAKRAHCCNHWRPPPQALDKSTSSDADDTYVGSLRSDGSVGSAGSVGSVRSVGSVYSVGSVGSSSSLASSASSSSVGSSGSSTSSGSSGCDPDRQARQRRNVSSPAIRWLHIPKCSSNFAITVLRHACAHLPDRHLVYMALAPGSKDLRMAWAVGLRHARVGTSGCGGRLLAPFAGHRPLYAHELRRAAAPSNFVHAAAATASAGGAGVAAMFRRPGQRLISAFLDNYHRGNTGGRINRTQMKLEAPTVDLWARYPGIGGCMAKMLAGSLCAEVVDAERRGPLLARALSVLRSDALVFVGLVEHWDLSICLFH